jgi:hypothetical protein
VIDMKRDMQDLLGCAGGLALVAAFYGMMLVASGYHIPEDGIVQKKEYVYPVNRRTSLKSGRWTITTEAQKEEEYLIELKQGSHTFKYLLTRDVFSRLKPGDSYRCQPQECIDYPMKPSDLEKRVSEQARNLISIGEPKLDISTDGIPLPQD